MSWWRNYRWHNWVCEGFSDNERDSIVSLQWLVAIAICYLVFAVQDWNLINPPAGLLIVICLGSGVIVQRIPRAFFANAYAKPALLIFDSLLVICAIFVREQTPWDLLMLFFFCVFIAAIGESLIQVSIASLLLSVVFLLFVSPNAKQALSISPDFIIRVPFIFGISLFYAYMSNQVKHEKKRLEQVEEAVRLKRQFASALAHDIKTPLNVILGHAELLAGDFGQMEDTSERLNSIKRIRQNIQQIVDLVTDFLAVSKLEAFGVRSVGNLVQMNEVAQEVVVQQMITAQNKKISLLIDLDQNPKPVMGERTQLQRALWNLVGNAIKFTPNGGTVRVASRTVKKEICIEVKDTGPGISCEDLPRLFSEFKRLKATAHTEGTGLGLFIVKTIVEAHNGRVAVTSQEGVGTQFTIFLPASKEPAAKAQATTLASRIEPQAVADRAA
jgi:signal transduction histidine kinase